MNQFIRSIVAAPVRKWDTSIFRWLHGSVARVLKNGLVHSPSDGFLLLSVVGAALILSLLAAPLSAQRVQFPTPAQPIPPPSPYTVQPGPYAPANPYAVPSAAATGPPSTFAPAVGPPPAFTSPYTTTAPPPAVVSPYPTTPYSPPPSLATPVPMYSPSAVGPPPLFDPYASGSSVAAPPPAIPYSPPPVAPVLTPPSTVIVPPSTTWQPAPVVTSGEGYWAKTQRFLQELSFEYTYLYGKHTDPFDLEINRAELSSTFAFPMFYNIETPLLVTPGFAFNWLEGPGVAGADLPPRLYDAYLDFAWYPRCYQWLGGELGFRTGVWSDFDHVSSDSIRFLGRGLASVALSPNLDILFGAVYLDRLDVKILPAGGVYWRPTPEWDVYAVFPNPKIRRFITAIGNSKWYGYMAGEYGGGSWTVERSVGDDRIDINDIRVIGGVEWETQTFIRGHVEMGYVFDREVVYNSGAPPTLSLDDTFMIRAGVDF